MTGRKYGQAGYKGRAKKTDANEKAIIKGLEAIPGCLVVPIGKPVDLLIGYNGKTFLVEVKNPEGKNKLEPAQVEFINEWKGGEIGVVRTLDEALVAIGHNVSGLHIATRLA